MRLRSAVANRAVGHAYLLAGPAEVGKTTLARSFAKAANCEQSSTLVAGDGDSCEVCNSCRNADAGTHYDIHLIRPALLSSEAEGG